MKRLERIRGLSRRLPSGTILWDSKTLEAHSGDKWFAKALPEAVAFPRTPEAVAAILAFASKHRIPVTARGSGYGYVGGCVPSKGGIALSLAHMNRILGIDPHDFAAVVQPGVITAEFQEQVERKGLYYPPDPASRKDCSLGGNIATNAGGPRCLKYGVTRDYVLGVQVALPNGSLVRLGARTHKNKTGFDLHRLFVGSEGMLGVVTEATLKLLPKPPYRACLGVGFADMAGAARAIRAIFAAGFLPSALELADEFTLRAAVKRTGSRLLQGCGAHMIIELDGHETSVRGELTTLTALLRRFRPLLVQRGLGEAGCERFWGLRREFSYSLRDTGLTKLNEDVVVPRGRLEDLFRLTRRLQRRHRLPLACFGHAGDGNIHVNVMLNEADAAERARSESCLDELFQGVLAMGGVITGEHGIGLAKRRWWPDAASPEVRALHHTIKRALDPSDILNPGKFLTR